ncbi:pallilysin-related adhesin [Treponema sp.]|uniref:pallilysin-related adhesin n=1 Tax=Treponema sp. TaxID=166 RepID=UPI0025EF9DFD|nr:pallilysin-related adhesin [Treponema sp.]MCR5218518.1 pallilysin-related adhesin [Treponema sp.]
MRRRIAAFLIVMMAALAAAVFFVSRQFQDDDGGYRASRFALSDANDKSSSKALESSSSVEETALVSLIQLKSDETLIGVVSMDFNGDGLEDQVNAVKSASSPYIQLIVGIYNKAKAEYERKAVIATSIVQTSSFTYTGIDLVGEHKNVLVYQGFSENSEAVLQAFLISDRSTGGVNVTQIADLAGDGTIFIQQADRYENYDRSNANGASYPIWVYTSDTSRASSMDQLQICYDWDRDLQKYVQTKTIRVAGSNITRKELAKIQDGTVATFAKFLEGLWYKSDSSSLYYLYFDYLQKEIIFVRSDIEEVYSWIRSDLRRNGIYLSCINQEIQNLQRRIDISLRSVDEINIRIQDDVRMLISESNVWDGVYKKFSQDRNYDMVSSRKTESFIKILEGNPSWKMADDTVVVFKEGTYTAEGDIISDTGFYTKVTLRDQDYIQFRSSSPSPLFKGMYKVSYGDSSNDSLLFKPYKVLPDEAYPTDERSVTLLKEKLPQE